MMKTKHSAIIAVLFAVTWLGILYAGADHPPPVGFIWIIFFVCMGGLVVFWRIPSYASWCGSRRPGRFALAMLDGFLAGLAVGIVTLLIPNTGEPSVALGFANVLTWLGVVMSVGALNALFVCWLTSTLIRSKL
jgi:hypothetical protein